jgi:WhiB family redox-sensing transcriptional regulator
MTNYDIGRKPTTAAYDWQLQGACREEGNSKFFHPDGERGPARERRVAVAKAICNQCPVIDACLLHALDVQEPYGIWGGKSEHELKRIYTSGTRPLNPDSDVEAS